MRKITEIEYVLGLNKSRYIYLSGYVSSRIPCKHECAVCGHEWLISPDNVRRGKGCPSCRNSGMRTVRTRPLMDYISMLGARNIEYVSGYLNSVTPCKHRCLVCDGIWEASPGNILHVSGCPSCAKSGYKAEQEAVLYFMRSADNSKLKIGISNNFKRRKRKLKSVSPFGISEYGFLVLKGEDARAYERQLHRRLKTHSAGLTGFDGSTEWFHANATVMHFVNQVLAGIRVAEIKKPSPKNNC